MRDYLDQKEQAVWRGPPADLPPVVLAALGPRMVGLAGARTAGVYPYFTTAEHIKLVRGQLGAEPFLAADLPVVLEGNRTEARMISNKHLSPYPRTQNYRVNLMRLGWKEADLYPPGSEELIDAVVAWGDIAIIRRRVRDLFDCGADHVVLNIITRDRSVPFISELRTLAALNADFK